MLPKQSETMKPEAPLVYVIEESDKIAALIDFYLQQTGFNVLKFANLAHCRESIEYLHPNALIVDISTNGSEGLAFCKQIKSDPATEHIKIIVLIDQKQVIDMEKIFGFGADDFIEKPFNLNELKMRIVRLYPWHASHSAATGMEKSTQLLQRTPTRKRRDDQSYKIRNMTINLKNYEIAIHKKKVDLSFSEFQLLVYLVKNNGTPCSREEIIKQDGGDKYIITDRAVDVRIAGLRKKLGHYGKMIKTIRSVGYMFVET